MSESIYEFVLAELNARRGEWREIASATGVSFGTVSKIGYRETLNPRVRNVEKLAEYFRAQKAS